MIDSAYRGLCALRVSILDCGNGVYRIDTVELGEVDGPATIREGCPFLLDTLRCVCERSGKPFDPKGWIGRILIGERRIWLTTWRGMAS